MYGLTALGRPRDAALFVQSAAATVARWVAGRHSDRRGPAGLMLPGLTAAAAGTLLTAMTHRPVAAMAGVALFGIGFGAIQNATLTLMYARVSAAGYGTVSALWNSAYDAGLGVGALGFGVLADGVGYPLAFTLTAALMRQPTNRAARSRSSWASGTPL
ncbi:hypothetical protein [Streptomyces tubercidicus]|uniref:hypothetical protein n=2 Tax=Streptomyces tubercidicus TaxID=47759 RepID=UPI0037BAB433